MGPNRLTAPHHQTLRAQLHQQIGLLRKESVQRSLSSGWVSGFMVVGSWQSQPAP